MTGYPVGFADLFDPVFIDYANVETRGTLQALDEGLVSRIHVVASPAPGLVTVCASVEGWRFLPGGSRERGESLDDTIGRELLEEAGCEPVGAARFFFSQIATSRNAHPYKPHFSHPVTWWSYAVVPSRIVGAPTSPLDGEQITEVHHLPVDEAIAWLAEVGTGATHADVLRLASHLDLIS